MSYRKRNIVGAAALAIVAVVFMLVYNSKAHGGGKSTPTKASGRVAVLVATRTITPGTPGNALQHGAFKTRVVSEGSAPPNAVTSVASLRGLVVHRTIVAGRPVSETAFGPAASSGVRIELRGRERVVQLEGDASQVLDGTLRRGDHVDILGTWNAPESCGECHVSRTIVHNALVLATSAELGKGSSRSTATVPVQLRLTAGQAARVFWMTKNGQWWLELRPVLHPRGGGQSINNAVTLLDRPDAKTGSNR
jgi:Flp pilus assembly protein CpaB